MYEQLTASRRKILVIESDFLEELRIALEGSGSAAAKSMDLTDQTVAALQGSDIGAAIVDSHLDSEKSVQIADALIALGIPFVFAEGSAPAQLPERLSAIGMMESTADLQLIAHQLFGAPTLH
jgi:hypothetical protein